MLTGLCGCAPWRVHRYDDADGKVGVPTTDEGDEGDKGDEGNDGNDGDEGGLTHKESMVIHNEAAVYANVFAPL